MQPRHVDRRQFLRGTTYALALPWLASLPGARALVRAATQGAPARRLVCVGTQLGFYKPEFFATGANPRLVRPLLDAGLDGRFTTLSGLDHKGPTGNGHDWVHTLYTGTIMPAISLDQYVAPRLGRDTRYESLQLCAGEAETRPTLSFTPAGVPMPATIRPSALFAQVFGAGSLTLARQKYLIESGKSLLDELRGEARSLQHRLGAEDREKLEEYLASIRSLEGQLARRRDWLDRPFPPAPAELVLPDTEAVDGSSLLATEDLMWDLMALALKNDSTRVVSFTIPITGRALLLDGALMKAGYHNLSHHGNKPDKIAELLKIEERHMRGAARFLAALAATPDGDDGSLLDTTVVLLGSAMGDAASHRRTNLPLLVAGGGLRHRRHLACGTEAVPGEMACDLYVTVLQQLGFEVEQFGSSQSDLNAELT